MSNVDRILSDLERETSELEDSASACSTAQPLELWKRIHDCRHTITDIRSGLRSKEALLRFVTRRSSVLGHGSSYDDEGPLLRDVQSSILSAQSELQHLAHRLSWCHTHHLAQYSLGEHMARKRILKVARATTMLLVLVIALAYWAAALAGNRRSPAKVVPPQS